MIGRLPVRRLVLCCCAAFFVAQVQAAKPQQPVGTPTTMAITVFGSDPCPKSTDDEIVVCAREPEGERYRLPKRFRGRAPLAAQGSWANTARELDNVSRQVIPNSCSAVGTNGQTGCFEKFIEENRRDPAPKN